MATQLSIPAVYMRGGTSKGVFFLARDLPADPAARDRVLLRVLGSPDPYAKQIDGMGAGTSSTSKAVILSKSERAGCDVDYLYAGVAIGTPLVDWSGNCGNLVAAVGPFAIASGLVAAGGDGMRVVRIWQANIGKRIIAHVPVKGGAVVEAGDFWLDGVAFPGAEIRIEFLEPGEEGAMFPTGQVAETWDVDGVGRLSATLINAGNPSIFVRAADLGLTGIERQEEVNGDAALLARLERVRARGAVRMGLAKDEREATEKRPHTPKLAWVAAPAGYVASSGKAVAPGEMDVAIRIMSMGKMHHAVTGTGAIAAAVAAAIPGTILAQLAQAQAGVIRLGHPSGIMTAGAEAALKDGQWTVSKVIMSRSARRLMQGTVFVPADPLG